MNTTMPMPEGVKRYEISTFKPKNDEMGLNIQLSQTPLNSVASSSSS
jgi:hypothetical protein